MCVYTFETVGVGGAAALGASVFMAVSNVNKIKKNNNDNNRSSNSRRNSQTAADADTSNTAATS
jgi:hypothetical protein